MGPLSATFKTKLGYREPELTSCKFVYIRDMHKKDGLAENFRGPYRVIAKYNKYFTIQFEKKQDNVALHRIKAAFIHPGDNKHDALHDDNDDMILSKPFQPIGQNRQIQPSVNRQMLTETAVRTKENRPRQKEIIEST